jgi:hypothetical protein
MKVCITSIAIIIGDVKEVERSKSKAKEREEKGFILVLVLKTSLNPVPNAQVCVYLTVHITKLQLQTTFPKPPYIPHPACIHQDPGR